MRLASIRETGETVIIVRQGGKHIRVQSRSGENKLLLLSQVEIKALELKENEETISVTDVMKMTVDQKWEYFCRLAYRYVLIEMETCPVLKGRLDKEPYDYVQEVAIAWLRQGLMEKYDPSQSAFPSYVRLGVRRKLIDIARGSNNRAKYEKRDTVKVDGEDEFHLSDAVGDDSVEIGKRKDLMDHLESLTDDSIIASNVACFVGFEGSTTTFNFSKRSIFKLAAMGRTPKEIAEAYSVTVDRVNILVDQLIKELRVECATQQ